MTASVVMGMAMEPKATGAVLASRQMAGRVEGRESQAREHGGGDRHGRAEAGRALDEGAEGEGDEQRLQPRVVGEVADANP